MADEESFGDAPVIREEFHKNKRALLIYSGALLAVSLAAPKIAGASSIVPVAIDHLALWWVIFGAAAYYLVGFRSEARYAKGRNNQFLKDRGVESVEASFDALQKQASQTSAALRTAAEQAQSTAVTLQSKVDNWDADPLDGLALGEPIKAGDLGEDLWHARRNRPDVDDVEHVLSALRIRIALRQGVRDQRLTEIGYAGRELKGAASEVDARFSEFTTLLKDTERSLRTLRTGLNRERREMFTWWDIRAPQALWILAVIIGAPELVAGPMTLIRHGHQLGAEWVGGIQCGWETPADCHVSK